MNASLFDPIPLGRGLARNRVAMAPMTRSRADDDGTPVPLMGDYYEQRAGAGLVVSEAVNISAQAQGFLKVPGIFNSAQVQAWAPIVARVQARQSLFFMQLWHVGRIAHPANMAPGLHPVAPSALQFQPHHRHPPWRAATSPTACAERRRGRADHCRLCRGSQARRRGRLRRRRDPRRQRLPAQPVPTRVLQPTQRAVGRQHQKDAPGSSSRPRRPVPPQSVPTAPPCALSPFSAFNGAESADEAAVYDHLQRTGTLLERSAETSLA